MQILILGGTSFVGRHLAEAALARGHQITLFHRGKTGADLFPEAEHIHGDRLEDLSGLEGKRWDAVIDTSAYIPRAVKNAAFLANQADRMLFISTISVYDAPDAGAGEEAKVLELEDPTTEEVNGDTYGGLKVLCEREIEKAWGDRALVLRPGLIVGPYDSTDRFTYWVMRSVSDQPFVAPPRMDQPLQVVDARDLANFGILGLEQGFSGTYNLVGPSEVFRFQDILPESRARQAKTEKTLPLVLPEDGERDGMFQLSHAKAVAAGLKHRPLAATIADTIAWNVDRGNPALKVGLTKEEEAELINTHRGI